MKKQYTAWDVVKIILMIVFAIVWLPFSIVLGLANKQK